MTSYPIDTILPELKKAVQNGPSVIVHAPPGAGKTTRVPLALLDVIPPEQGRIIMLEPRRIAAVSAARWMARTLGEEVGGTVGYAIRFDSRSSAKTRIEVVTEGILTRRIQADPGLAGVAMVIFDEFHERSLHADLALALALDVRKGLRPRPEGPHHVRDHGHGPHRLAPRQRRPSSPPRERPFPLKSAMQLKARSRSTGASPLRSGLRSGRRAATSSRSFRVRARYGPAPASCRRGWTSTRSASPFTRSMVICRSRSRNGQSCLPMIRERSCSPPTSPRQA